MSPLVAASAGNVLVWIVWVVAAFSCLASGIAVVTFTNPFFSALALTTGGLGHEPSIARSFGSPASIGRLFLTDHLLAFEVTSIVLLAAAVGGVILGHHSRRFDARA